MQDPIFDLTAGTIHHDWATGVTRTLEWNLGSDPAGGRQQQPAPLRTSSPGVGRTTR